MTKCTCGRNPGAVQIALYYRLPVNDIPVNTCEACIAAREEEDFRQRQAAREEAHRRIFMAMPEHPDRWDAVFDFMYKQGWRP